MKPLTCSILLALASLSITAQKIEIEFTNGEKKTFEMEYDDPFHLPRTSVHFDFFNPIITGDISMGFRLSPEFRINRKLTANATLCMPYGKKLDGNVGDRRADDPNYKATMVLSGMAHYNLVNWVSTRIKSQAIGYGSQDGMGVIYKAKVPRNKARSIIADGGITQLRVSGTLDLEKMDQTSDTNFIAPYASFTTFNVGFSYMNSESYKMKLDDFEYSYLRYGRLYGYAMIALAHNYNVLARHYENNDTEEWRTTEGYVEPKFTRIGWRAGYVWHMGFKGSRVGMNIGLEFGANPTLTSQPNPPRISEDMTTNGWFVMRWGITWHSKERV